MKEAQSRALRICALMLADLSHNSITSTLAKQTAIFDCQANDEHGDNINIK
jgi:hypothetical protein